MGGVVTDKTLSAPGGRPLGPWLLGRIAVILVAFAFFGYSVWAGIGNFLGVQNERFAFGLEVSLFGWIATGALVVLPIVVFAVCIIVTRRMRLGPMIFVFAAGAALTAVVNLDVVLALPTTVIFVT